MDNSEGLQRPSPSSDEDVRRAQSAGELLKRVAAELLLWVRRKRATGTVDGRQWLFVAILTDGRQMIVHELSADGPGLVRLEGQLHDGTPCLMFSHQHSIQFLIYFAPISSESTQHREIGFHVGREEIRVSTDTYQKSRENRRQPRCSRGRWKSARFGFRPDPLVGGGLSLRSAEQVLWRKPTPS